MKMTDIVSLKTFYDAISKEKESLVEQRATLEDIRRAHPNARSSELRVQRGDGPARTLFMANLYVTFCHAHLDTILLEYPKICGNAETCRRQELYNYFENEKRVVEARREEAREVHNTQLQAQYDTFCEADERLLKMIADLPAYSEN